MESVNEELRKRVQELADENAVVEKTASMASAELAEQKSRVEAKIREVVEARTSQSMGEVMKRFEEVVKEKVKLEKENEVLKEMVEIMAHALEGISQDVEKCRNEFTGVRAKAFSD